MTLQRNEREGVPAFYVGHSTHPVLKWAEANIAGLGSALGLRESVIGLYPSLPTEVREAGRFGALNKLAKTHAWEEFEPTLTNLVLSLSTDTAMNQREVVGFAKLAHDAVRNYHRPAGEDRIAPKGIDLTIDEYSPRLAFAEDFKDPEDWLAAISQVVVVNGTQREGDAKEKARAQNVTAFTSLGRVNLADLEQAYRDTVKLVRPTSEGITLYRDKQSRIDRGIAEISQNFRLGFYFGSNSVREFRDTVDMYLTWYNDMVLGSRVADRSESPTWITGTYLAIHPHPDYNHTMTRTLVDTYLAHKGLPLVNWRGIKRDERSRRAYQEAIDQYIFRGDTKPLADQFQKNKV